MTQITVTLENGADANLINKIFQNVKGVLKTHINEKKDKVFTRSKDKEAEEWINNLHDLVKRVDKSVIDMNDDRTRYILSK